MDGRAPDPLRIRRSRVAGRPSRPRHAALRTSAAALALGVVAILVLLALPATHASGTIGPQGGSLSLIQGPVQGPAPSGPILSLVNASVVASETPGFLGANVRPYYALGAPETAAYSASGLQFVRWPGGATVDEFNVTANEIYANNGTSYAPPTNISAFATWCESIGCHAIVGLPAEIDSPSTAAYYVSYIEHTVGFTPAYWEIGNEPATWTHFGTPWAQWNTSQDQNATPGSYALLLHRYISAVRAVAPSARFVGLGGLGTGAYGEATWITATVRENGANLSAISIHVYPAGGATAGNVSAQSFYATLSDNSALSVRVPIDRAAITSACSSCHILLLASELGSGTSGGPYATYMAGFPVVPFLAAEVVQALDLNLSQIDLFAFEGTYAGSILNGAGQATEVATLYDTFLAPLRSQILATNLTSPTKGFYVLATRAEPNGAAAILVANTNVSASLTFQLRTPGSLPSPGTFTLWSASDGAPVRTTSSSASSVAYRVGPESIALIQVGTGIIWGRSLPTPPTQSLGLMLSLPPSTVQGLLGLAAPTSMTFPCWAVATARRRAETSPNGAAYRPYGSNDSVAPRF